MQYNLLIKHRNELITAHYDKQEISLRFVQILHGIDHVEIRLKYQNKYYMYYPDT